MTLPPPPGGIIGFRPEAGKKNELLPLSVPEGETIAPLLIVPCKIPGSGLGVFLKTSEALKPKFLARTSGGVCLIQLSALKVVPTALKLGSSKIRRHSLFSSKPWMTCGSPLGKYQMSPTVALKTSLRPSSLTAPT